LTRRQIKDADSLPARPLPALAVDIKAGAYLPVSN